MLKPLNETKFKFWIVDPVESINHVENPLPWTLEGYSKSNPNGSLEVRTEHMRNGGPCLRAINTGIKYTKPMTKLETDEQYELLVDAYAVKDTVLTVHVVKHNGPTIETKSFRMGGNWQWLRIPFIGVHGVTFEIEIADQEGDIVDDTFWIDRLSVQKGTNMTWFCGYGFSADTSLHFRWEGEPMNSRSIHNGQDRRAGKMYDLDDYMKVKQVLGLGMGDWEQRMTPVLTGGALYQDMIEQPRPFSIVGVNKATKMKDLMLKRKQLSLLLRPDGNDHSPINLLFQAVNKVHGYPESEELTIECVCTSALKNMPDVDTVADSTLTFMKPDPYLYANHYNGYKQGQDIEIKSDNIILRKANGGWQALPGLDGEVRCLAEDNAGRIWAGGDFTGKIAYSRGGAWQVPRTAYGEIAPNGSVRAIAVTPDNQVFFGGDFTTITHGSTTMTVNRIARLKPTTSAAVWSLTQLQGTGINDGTVHALLIDNMGKLVIGGDFSSANGSTSRGITRYNTVISGTNPWKQYTGFKAGAQVFTLEHSGRANVVCLGGEFESTMGTIKNLARLMLDTGTVMSFGSPVKMQGEVNKIAKRPDGSFVIAGFGVGFSWSETGFIHEGCGQIRGSSTSPLSNHQVVVEGHSGMRNVFIDEDGGAVLFANERTWVDATNNCGRYPYFKNGAWNRHPEVSMITDGGTGVYVNDMLILRNGDTVYAGSWSINIMLPPASPAIMPIFSEATAGVYPIIRVFGSNRLHFIRSYKTGKVIFFKEAYIPHGSWLEMSLRRDKIQIMLDWKNALNLIGDGSDYANFTLEPELNLVHVHAQKLDDDPIGVPGDIFVLWQPRYWSLEGSIHGTV